MSNYTAVAAEYYDPVAHPTCHNFSRLSRRYIVDQLSDLGNGERILELGAGSSTAAAALYAFGRSLDQLEITDASEAMLAHSSQWAAQGAILRIADATALPHGDGSFDCIVASLADPYNVPALWASIFRVLRSRGRAIVTLPSCAWADRFRATDDAADFHTAEFTLRNGKMVHVPSFVLPLSRQVRMIEQSGLVLSGFISLGSDLLPNERLSPKVQVFGDAVSSLVWGFTALKS